MQACTTVGLHTSISISGSLNDELKSETKNPMLGIWGHDWISIKFMNRLEPRLWFMLETACTNQRIIPVRQTPTFTSQYYAPKSRIFFNFSFQCTIFFQFFTINKQKERKNSETLRNTVRSRFSMNIFFAFNCFSLKKKSMGQALGKNSITLEIAIFSRNANHLTEAFDLMHNIIPSYSLLTHFWRSFFDFFEQSIFSACVFTGAFRALLLFESRVSRVRGVKW